ncbi:hypothetical protein [Streptomyces sp. NEAU-W12]|uniref:hypothetical protein n=1 Tax=Streptomyces sp. NEAU-W12 TaxID=2994668 RepID=UPI00224B82D6|nr:hypothetical protein [Streptomyces sp. NEAU-W12]MCX2923344.1 hypothetical protein [Streptomyces sp. NEAU-W12]
MSMARPAVPRDRIEQPEALPDVSATGGVRVPQRTRGSVHALYASTGTRGPGAA